MSPTGLKHFDLARLIMSNYFGKYTNQIHTDILLLFDVLYMKTMRDYKMWIDEGNVPSSHYHFSSQRYICQKQDITNISITKSDDGLIT